MVTSGNTLPQFTERDYVVHISENELPPQFLIDIDTTEELLGVPVQYEIVQLNVDEPGNHIGRLKRNQGFDTGMWIVCWLGVQHKSDIINI